MSGSERLSWFCPGCGQGNDWEDTSCLACGWDAPIGEDGRLDRRALRAYLAASKGLALDYGAGIPAETVSPGCR